MTERTLKAYLRQKASAMRDAAERRPNGEDWLEHVEAVCVADDATGVRKLRIRDWQIISDSGLGFGGWGLGPSSPELLCGVISTCLTHTYLIAAAQLEIPLERVAVHVDAENNDAGLLNIETADPPLPFNITARVNIEALDASPDQVAMLHRYVDERCPLTRLVRTANSLTIVAG